MNNPAPDQAHAITSATTWYRTRRRNHYRLEGPAGSGKTTLVHHIANTCAPGTTAYIAPTGKAAAVLRAKGCDGATTIHAAIYAPAGERTTTLAALRKELATLDPRSTRAHELERTIDRVRQQPLFNPRPHDKAFGGKKPNLIVLDEASMVDDRTFADLSSYQIPILALGDPYQLPPVNGPARWRTGAPDAQLTTIHRGADTAPIIDLATALRNGHPTPPWNGAAGATTAPWKPADLARYDQIIVGRRTTRWIIINAIRASHGHPAGVPVIGDRIMCLRNDPAFNVINGQQATITAVTPADDAYCLTVTTDTGEEAVWLTDQRGFTDQDGQEAAKADRDSDTVAATFAHAVTCHSAQGSQWPRVAVVNEARAFRGGAAKWLYTAASRAERVCVIVDPAKMIHPASATMRAEVSDRLTRQHTRRRAA
ncbi:MAG TPA: AAA family ATPase [Micromonosporaceae bacterium]|nr:AAA family ATPase [Micromonosporaceae bacterium]